MLCFIINSGKYLHKDSVSTGAFALEVLSNDELLLTIRSFLSIIGVNRENVDEGLVSRSLTRKESGIQS